MTCAHVDLQRGLAILVNYRNADEIIAAVAALLADAPGLPVVVVDNSEQEAEAQALRHGLPAGVRLCIADSNLGFGRACNLGLARHRAALAPGLAAACDWVFLVNPDVRVLPGCVATLAAALLNDPKLAAVAPRQYLDTARQWLLPPSWLPTALRAWVSERCLRDPVAARRYSLAARAEWLRLAQAPAAGAVVRQRALSGGAVMLRCSDLQPEGQLFDPRFFMYFEDSDLCLRLRQHGRRLAVVPAAEAVHLWANTPAKAPLMAAGSALYFAKHYPPPDPWLARARAWQGRPVATPLLGAPVAPGSEGMPLPEAWAEGWLLEISPSPLLIPATGYFGRGRQLAVPPDNGAQIRARFPGAPLYGRVGPVQTTADTCWRYLALPPLD